MGTFENDAVHTLCLAAQRVAERLGELTGLAGGTSPESVRIAHACALALVDQLERISLDGFRVPADVLGRSAA